MRRAEHNDLTLGPTSSDNPMIAINRSRFLAAGDGPGWPVLKLNQVHSSTIHDMKDTWASNEPRKGDAAITDFAEPCWVDDWSAAWAGVRSWVEGRAVARSVPKLGLLVAVVVTRGGVVEVEVVVGEGVLPASGKAT